MAEYLVRHGQTDWNVSHKIMGRADVDLNDTGKQQAAAMRDNLAAVQFAAIFYSPLKRARQTAEIIQEAHDTTPFIEAAELIERDFGKYEGETNSPDGNYYGLWDYSRNVDTEGGESLQDLQQRVFPFLDRIRNEYSGLDVLLVAHGGIGLVIRQYYNGVPDSGNLLELPPVAHGGVEILG